MRVEKDRIEKEGNEFQKRVRNQYLNLSENEPDRIIVINGEKSIDEVRVDIWNHIKQKFNL